MNYTNDLVPIVLASNNNYVPFMATTIASIISTASSSRNYKIFVFHTKIKKEYQKIIKAMSTQNVDIEFVNVKKHLHSANLYTKGYFSVEMYYRFLIPEVLSEYKKVIYLDSDLIVLKDIAELYNIEIENNIIAAVRDCCAVEESSNDFISSLKNYVENVLKLNVSNYFNSGVLIFNTTEFLKYNLKKQFFEFLKYNRHLRHPDQDVLNLFCGDKCMMLPEKWNFQTGNPLYLYESKKSKAKDACIVHFSSSIKPWNNTDVIFAEEFLEIAKTTAFYPKIIKRIKKSAHLTNHKGLVGELYNSLRTLGIKATCNRVKKKLSKPFNRIFKKIDKKGQPIITEEDIDMAKKRNYSKGKKFN